MSEQTKPTGADKRRGVSIGQMLLAASTVVAAVVAVAMTDPKLPPLAGD